jgi:DNA repair protein RadC
MTASTQLSLFAAGVAEARTLPFARLPDSSVAVSRRLAAIGALDEAETLELLMERCLPANADPAAAAAGLLARFGGIARIVGAPHTDLARVIGQEAAAELGVLHALLLRVLDHPLRRRPSISSWEAAKTYLRCSLSALPREVFHVLFLDKKNQLIADERMGEGSIDHAPVYPREVVRRALELSAGSLLLAHNHPSGDPTPSRADIEMTKAIVEAARPLGIAVHDHLIVGGDQMASLKGLGLI